MSDHTRPGALPLRPLTTGELLDSAAALLRLRGRALVGLGILFAAVEQALLFPLRTMADQDITMRPGTGKLSEYGLLVVVGFGTETVAISTLALVAAGAIGPALLGRFTPPHPPVRYASAALSALLVGAIVVICVSPFQSVVDGRSWVGLIFLAWTLLIVLWAPAYGLTGLAAPAAVLERRDPFSAVARSIRLSSRTGMRAAFIRLLGYLSWVLVRVGLILATLSLIELIWGSLPSSTWDRVALAIAGLLVNAVAYPVLGCLDAMLLVEARMRTEGLDIALRWSLRRGVAPSLDTFR